MPVKKRYSLAMRGIGVLVAAAALTAAACGQNAQATHRPSATQVKTTTVIHVHDEANRPLAKGTWAWTPDVPIKTPVAAAWRPSVAARKIERLGVGDTVAITGELAGVYEVILLAADGKDHDLMLTAVGRGDDDRILERVDAATVEPVRPRPIGRCVVDPDHIGGSTCEISTYATRRVHVFLENYNDHPVRIVTVYADYDHQDVKTRVATRVPAHSGERLTLPWGTATTLYVQWIDKFNGHNLGSQLLDRP